MFEVKWRKVVLVLHLGVMDIDQVVLLGHFCEIGKCGTPLVGCLAFEYCRKVRNRVGHVVEWTSLVHSDLTDAAVPCEHDVQVAVSVVQQLNLVEEVGTE